MKTRGLESLLGRARGSEKKQIQLQSSGSPGRRVRSSGPPHLRAGDLRRSRQTRGGFSLLEVLLSIAIIAVVTVVLLGRRVEILRDTQVAKDQRLAWALAAQKMSDIELDPYLFQGESGSSSGDFADAGNEYRDFTWRYDASKEDVPTNESRQDPPKRIFRVRLFIQKAGTEGDLVTLEAMFPIQEAGKRP